MPRRGAEDWAILAANLADVEPWYRHLQQRNKDSADVIMRNVLRGLAEARGIRPAALLALDDNALHKELEAFVAFYQQKNLLGSTISKYLDSVKSYLSWHDRKIKRPIFIRDAEDHPKAEAQELPVQSTIAALLMECNVRTAVMVSLECFSGLRPRTLGLLDGSDGLRLGDLPELVIREDQASFSKVPAMIQVRKPLSKTRKAYFTFIGPQGADYIVNYLNQRMRQGELLGPDSPLVSAGDGDPRFLHRTNIQNSIRARMKQVGLHASTYVHRSYFNNRLIAAESQGVPAIYRRFWMGHSGELEIGYGLRRRLTPDLIEEMREAYSRALPFLETHNALPPLPRPRQVEIPVTPRVRQKVVASDEVSRFLAMGWHFVALLPTGQAIVQQE